MIALARRTYGALLGIEDRLWLPQGLVKRSDAIFRFTLSLIFIIGGLGHFAQLDEMLARIAQSPWAGIVMRIGDPAVLLWLSGGAFVFFGVSLALGLFQRISALVLFVTLLPITLSIHLAPGHVGPLFKNVAILGALLFIYARGNGPK